MKNIKTLNIDDYITNLKDKKRFVGEPLLAIIKDVDKEENVSIKVGNINITKDKASFFITDNAGYNELLNCEQGEEKYKEIVFEYLKKKHQESDDILVQIYREAGINSPLGRFVSRYIYFNGEESFVKDFINLKNIIEKDDITFVVRKFRQLVERTRIKRKMEKLSWQIFFV